MPSQPCPCGSETEYSNCCGPFLDRSQRPETPEQLMRSRYTAFCRGDADYLIATLAPEKRSDPLALAQLRQELSHTMATTEWLGLKVLNSAVTGPGEGRVEFAAFFRAKDLSGQGKTDQGIRQLHEKSRFVRQEGRWFYRDGEMGPGISLGRNDPCFCSSGKKYKKCHGKSS